jgi:DNA-binding transcriptional ArsR family regulator
MSVTSANQLDQTFSALADPTRRAILFRLMLGEASVTELVAPFDLAQPTISKRLKVLEGAGLIERRRDAQFRRCRLNATRLSEAWGWLGNYRRFWEESLDRLEVLARELHAQQTRPHTKETKRDGRKRRQPSRSGAHRGTR